MGCKTYELDLTVNPSSNAPIYMEEDICEGETYSFFGRILYQEGLYYSNTNCNVYKLNLTVNTRPILQCTKDTIVEYGNLVRLTASGADAYLWSTGDTTESITICSLIDRTYSVTGYSKTGCSSTASVTVKVNNEDDEIILYPNPAGNLVEVYMPLIDEVEVFNLLGEPIERVSANRQPVQLDVSRYADGVYIVHARQMKKHHFKKLVIQH